MQFRANSRCTHGGLLLFNKESERHEEQESWDPDAREKKNQEQCRKRANFIKNAMTFL